LLIEFTLKGIIEARVELNATSQITMGRLQM